MVTVQGITFHWFYSKEAACYRGVLLTHQLLDAAPTRVLNIGLVCRFSDLYLVSKPVFFLNDAVDSDTSLKYIPSLNNQTGEIYLVSSLLTHLYQTDLGCFTESTWKVSNVSFYWLILWLICFFIHVSNTCKYWQTWACWQHIFKTETLRV